MNTTTNTEASTTATRFATATKDGESIELSGDSVADLAKLLAEYGDASLSATVVDEPGFTRGWIHGDGSWTAQ